MSMNDQFWVVSYGGNLGMLMVEYGKITLFLVLKRIRGGVFLQAYYRKEMCIC